MIADRVFPDVSLAEEILDLVDSLLQFSTPEDGMRVVRRARSHGQQEYNNAENTSRLC